MIRIDTVSEHYSIVIVGAGPAGCNLARMLKVGFHKTLLVDGTALKGGKVCAGLLSPDAQDLLAGYDISLPQNILVSPQLFSVRTIDLEQDRIRHYRRSYMNVDRAALDRFLLEMVPDPIEVLSAVCASIRSTATGFTVELRTENGMQTVSCDFLVGADGASSVVRKTLFPDRKIQKYVAIQQWFSAKQTNPYYSCIFDRETSESCSWIFFKNGQMVFGGAFAPHSCRAAFEAQKRKLTERGLVPPPLFETPLRTEACLVCRPHLTYGMLHGNAKAFLIGEAAGLISPSSLEGISYALRSAEALAEAFNKADRPEAILPGYIRRIRGLFCKIRVKCLKRPFMYQKNIRALILRTGLGAMKIKR